MTPVERVSAVTRFSALDSLTGFISSDVVVGLLTQNRIWSSVAGGADVLIARPIEETSQTKWLLSHADELDMEFCYLGDVIRAGGGCGLRIATRIRCAWGKFPELLLLITSRRLSFKTRGRI